MKTNIGLVEYAKRALNEKWGYVWGTFGHILTEKLFAEKIAQYPDGVGNFKEFIRRTWLGRRATDCVGLIKSYCWYDEVEKTIKYSPKSDHSANSMYQAAKVKGSINTMPDIPGICVWKKGHIGVYIGGGYVIEARGTRYGVVKTPLTGPGSNPWTNWLECPYVEYIKPEVPKTIIDNNILILQKLCVRLKIAGANGKPLVLDGINGPNTQAAIAKLPELKKGSRNNSVIVLQSILKIKQDGIFGIGTETMVKKFQTENGFAKAEINGIVNVKTWKYLAKVK